MRARSWAGLVILCLAAACGPDLGGLERGEDGRVAEIRGGAGLALEGGQRVFLAEIDAPRGDAPFAREARAELETLAQGRNVRLAYGGEKRWRPRAAKAEDGAEPVAETAIAHVFVKSEGGRWFWLQHEMVSRGAAYVRPRPANHARVRELFAIEAEARAAKRGLWALPEYRVLNAATAAEAAKAWGGNCRDGDAPYRIIEARVAEARVQERRAELVLEAPGQGPTRGAAVLNAEAGAPAEGAARPFSIVVFGAAFADWDGEPLFSFGGERVRARGSLGVFRGSPQLCIDRHEQIEVVGKR